MNITFNVLTNWRPLTRAIQRQVEYHFSRVLFFSPASPGPKTSNCEQLFSVKILNYFCPDSAKSGDTQPSLGLLVASVTQAPLLTNVKIILEANSEFLQVYLQLMRWQQARG